MKKILIIRMGNIGDVLRATPLIRAVKAAQPHARIDVLTSAMCGFLFERNPDVHTVIRHKKPKKLFRIFMLWRLRLRLAAAQYDEVVLLETAEQSVGFAEAAAAGRATVYAFEHERMLGRGFRLYRYEDGLNVVELYLRLYFGEQSASKYDLNLALYPDPNCVAKVRKEFFPLLKQAVVVHCSTTGTPPYRGFDPMVIAPALEAIAARGYALFFTGLDDDLKMFELLPLVLKTKSVFFVSHTLPEVVALISLSRAVISPDTGIFHFATALRKPVVGIWGPTSADIAGGAGDSPSVIVRAGCLFNPCFDHNSSSKRAFAHCATGEIPPCLKNIDNDAVVKAFDGLMSKGVWL